MTDKLPEVPPAYQPPATVPLAPWEPPLVETGPPQTKRGLATLVITLGLLLCLGAVVLAIRLWPQSKNETSPAAVTTTAPAPEATTPEVAVTGLPELQALPATAEQDLKDATDGTSTSIRFTNTTSETVSVSWLNYDHNRTWYADLAPGQSYDQQTYTGHVWVITRTGGTALALYVATTDPAEAIIKQ
ncbi:VHL beta domain-containing protein [Actinoplanes awajinensis]|uniref:von Hippel-Lindau disease tumour suppressor beta domain-containing protein n=1 Tax=Actinoplanes awajinensis subsp. mycoplanecinus TaxID=135947 RepID=A0A0X3V9E7_9ACTN|nr:hypothetical protein [Actinoplanes awajinensis]KUL41401.1 hypothetical protein ADL15_03890 [Actinoplanes awajinensis subsp. mycoplanecinus]